MYKFTKDGLTRVGEDNEISQEDQNFIRDMFEDFANSERSMEDLRITPDD